LGKLCVGFHERSFDLVVGEVLILPQLTSLTLSKLHLLVEFKFYKIKPIIEHKNRLFLISSINFLLY